MLELWDRISYAAYMLWCYAYDFFAYSSEDVDGCCRR